MSEFREYLLQMLVPSSVLPRALMRTWAAMETDELEAMVRLRFNLDAPTPVQFVVAAVVSEMRAVATQTDHPLHKLPPNELRAAADFGLARAPSNPQLIAVATSLRMLADDRERTTTKARASAAAPRKKRTGSIEPYVSIWTSILDAGRFKTNAAQAAAFSREVTRQRLEPVSDDRRRDYKRRALELIRTKG